MPATLGDYLDITPDEAGHQFTAILHRAPAPEGKRQVAFLPVETLLCMAASLLIQHRKFGSANAHTAGMPVPDLAKLFKRKPTSILAKMANLDGTRPNGAKWELKLGEILGLDSQMLSSLYRTVLLGARSAGVSPELLPDFLNLEFDGAFVLLGQDELADIDVPTALASEIEQTFRSASEFHENLTESETERLVIARARIGQHVFAAEVLANCGNACVFCGMSIGKKAADRMLIASHIKPWKDSVGSERIDVANGLAACPTHDVAFDAGLLMVNGGLRIHASQKLQELVDGDPVARNYFSKPPLLDRILLPQGAAEPAPKYLEWHKANIFQVA